MYYYYYYKTNNSNNNRNLIPLHTVLTDKPMAAHLLKKLPTCYKTQRFITIFTVNQHWPLATLTEIN